MPVPYPADTNTMRQKNTPYFVYIVECSDKTLYTGITTDIKRRIKQHNGILKGGASYTKNRKPVVLKYTEKVCSRSVATKREHEIKKLTHDKKTKLIFEQNKP